MMKGRFIPEQYLDIALVPGQYCPAVYSYTFNLPMQSVTLNINAWNAKQ